MSASDADASIALVVRRQIRAPVAKVFDAWTRPEHLVRWWGPRPAFCPGAEIDLRPGGQYRIANQFPDGNVIWIAGEFERVEPPDRLVYTWRTRDDAPLERVTVRFEAKDGGTLVVVVHERIPDAPTREDHLAGWDGCLDGLERYLSGS